jgi:hypothetical protein
MTKRSAPTDETRANLVNALAAIYNDCGPDLGWADKTPSQAEFVDVLRDLLASTGESHNLTANDMDAWHALSNAAKRKLCLEVGP